MAKINIICIGNLKETYWRSAVSEYSMRLKRYCDFSVTELSEYRLPDKPSDKTIARALEKEAEAMKKFLEIKNACNIALCIEGKTMTSEALSEKLTNLFAYGVSTVNFYIGSSFGLSPPLKSACDIKLSMSPMTFPHQLARVMLCEQIYRAFSISGNAKYHK